MYLEAGTKFYEIVTVGKTVYVHFGRIPSLENPQLPFGTFQAFTFTTRKEAIKYMDKKVQEKKTKKYNYSISFRYSYNSLSIPSTEIIFNG